MSADNQCPWMARSLGGNYYCQKKRGHGGDHVTSAGHGAELAWERPPPPAPLREGHALGLLEELQEALRRWDGLFGDIGNELAFETRALLSRADALSPVGELRTWPSCQSCIELRQDLNDARDQLERLAGDVREERTWQQERADVVAFLRRWVAVRPSIAGHFADEFEAGKHVGASQETARKEPGRG